MQAPALLALALPAFAGSRAYDVRVSVAGEPILSFRQGTTSWQQVFNPTWVEPTAATGGKSGLLVRTQNCTLTDGKCGPTCAGTGDHASWLTWAELAGDGPGGTPSVVNHVGAASAVFGPFDCAGWAPPVATEPAARGSPPPPPCPDARGTEDPRLTLDPDTGTYFLLYNAWASDGAVRLSLASAKDPTSRSGWTRHGELFPDAGLGSYKSGSIVLMPPPSKNHYVIWGCEHDLRITPSVGRSLLEWNYSTSKVLLSTRGAPFWDHGFVESAMPPLALSDGNLLFWYNSAGPWNGTSGFQPGWAVLSGDDPTVVLARASTPPMPFGLPWEAGAPPWPCNTPRVTNLGGGHAVGNNTFRLYFGGADAVVGTAIATVALRER